MERFAFILHPLVVQDMARKFPLLRYLPESFVESCIKHVPPIKVSHITGIRSPYAEAEGWFVACPLTARQMMSLPEDFVIDRIVAAGKVAEKLGAKIVGLGAFTSVVADAGISVAKKLDIAVTSGNSYTVATALDGTRQALSLMGGDMKNANVAVLGATGSIGAVCSRILAKEAKRVTLVARNQERLQHLAFEHFRLVLLPEIDRGATAASVAGAHGMGDGRHAPVHRLLALHGLRPGRRGAGGGPRGRRRSRSRCSGACAAADLAARRGEPGARA